MIRDLKSLSRQEFDLLIIGGGVQGLAIARDAAARGLSVALIEADDFGSGNSGNSQKIVHGGLRYLQHADLRRMRESIRERRILLATAPHLVQPLGFLLPTRGHGLRGRMAMGAALALNDLIGMDRNATRDPLRRLPRGRLLSMPEAEKLAPQALPAGSTGAALWYDAQMLDSERLLLSIARAAHDAGAVLANHASVKRFLGDGERVTGATVLDTETGEELPVQARLTVNASGARSAAVLGLVPGLPPPPATLSVAMNLVIRRPLVQQVAVGVSCPVTSRDPDARIQRGERLLFATPWDGATIIGTMHLPWTGDTSAFHLERRYLDLFIEDLTRAMPWADITESDISLIHRGLLPTVAGAGDARHAVLEKQYQVVDHKATHGLQGLISVIGVKWTTARDVAQVAVDTIFGMLGKTPPPCKTATTPLPGGEISSMETLLKEAGSRSQELGCPAAACSRLAQRYGTLWPEIVTIDSSASSPLAPGSLILRGEILHALRREMATTLVDIVRRRTGMGSLDSPGDEELDAAATLAGEELGWSADRTGREISAVKELYRLPV